LTDHYTIVNSDGSLNRTRTLSDSTATSPSITFAFDGGGKLVGRTQPNRNCTYSPAYRPVAPASAVIGEAYSTSTTLACQYLPNGSATATNVTLNGTVLAAESLTVGAGTFDTVKMTQTESTSNTALTTTSIQNYWTDRITGRTIKVTSSYTETPTGKIAPSYQENNARELVGYYLKGQKGGAIVRRFAGNWAMVIEDGQDRFNCPISVDSNGQFSGNNCDGTPVVINGVVGESGAASGSTGDGASFSGTFTSPSRATGTWKNGSNSGTWTAAHQ
jgi:hypothetical protein